MLKYALPALVTASLWATNLAPAQAQGTQPAPPPGAAATAPSPAPAPANPEVVGSVDGKPITWTQLFERMRKDNAQGFALSVAQVVGTQAADTLFGPGEKTQFTITREEALAGLRKQPTQLVRSTLREMLAEQAVDQLATQEGAAPTDAQVNARVSKLFADLHKQNAIPANMTDDQFLQSRGIARDQLATRMRQQMELFTLIQKDLEKSLGHPIGPEDFIQARHILLSVPPAAPTTKPEEQKKIEAEKLAKINAIAAEIKSGKKTFEQEAKENSDDSSKATGGDHGPFMRGVMVKEFETTAFSLKPGELSKPVRSQFGYHLIEVEKLGKDIPADQRQAILEQYEQNHAQVFVNQTLPTRVKMVDNLPKPPPSPMGLPPGVQAQRADQ
jgi:parvulin-like peptidyl-prolyl isomerase